MYKNLPTQAITSERHSHLANSTYKIENDTRFSLTQQIVGKKTSVIDEFDSFLTAKQYQDPKAFSNFLLSFREETQRQEKVLPREEIIKKLGRIRAVCAESPFIERAQTWPRGYQGDFETINYIMEARNKAPEGTLGYVIEDYFLNSDICLQHKNKVDRQAELIKQAIDLNPNANIISIGCGTSEDVRQCIPLIRNSHAEITLVDVDQGAIEFSLQQLASVKERVTAIHGNIYKVMRTLTETYDLVLIGGVFDYLSDKTIISVLTSLRQNLSTTGRLFFTNIARNNPYRVFMEYIGNWTLIERSKRDLARLVSEAGWREGSCRIGKDNTGLTHLVELFP